MSTGILCMQLEPLISRGYSKPPTEYWYYCWGVSCNTINWVDQTTSKTKPINPKPSPNKDRQNNFITSSLSLPSYPQTPIWTVMVLRHRPIFLASRIANATKLQSNARCCLSLTGHFKPNWNAGIRNVGCTALYL